MSSRRWFHAALVAWSLITAANMSAAPVALGEEPEYSESERDHWSLRPRAHHVPPVPESTSDRAWVRQPTDAWVLARLQKSGLRPAAEADRATLVRRLTYDLVGLPPDPELVDEFRADDRPDAYERLVDRLLASPRHGEHVAQHWLDVVRFSETEGFEYDQHRPGAWRYRDYVIESLNADKPFDRFAREQLAGDELAQSEADTEPLVAVGFHRLGPVRRNAGNGDVAFSRQEVLTEMTDAIGTVFLGLTVGCARCHDHKFDPIRQSDYYRLQAFVASTDEHDVPVAPPDVVRRWRDDTQRIKSQIKQLQEQRQEADGEQRERINDQIKQLDAQLPAPLPTLSSVQAMADRTTAVHVLHRGQTDKPKELVGPRPLGVLVATSVTELPHDLKQPKNRLADWLLDTSHPLTSRVLANRIWQAHFGSGIVATPNDFGLNGAPPSHPELLDDLASRLVDRGWRLKPLRRELVTSAAYRQASSVPADVAAAARRKDPDNHWLWRYPRRRLTAEQLRDTLLSVSGRLQPTMGGPSVIVPVEQELVDLLYKPSQWEVTANRAEHDRRSVYLLAKRNLRVPFLEVFDQPDLQTSCARREASTHAPQALELLNGAVANDLADAFAQRLEREAGHDVDRQVELAFRLALGRLPTNAERQLASQFLANHAPRELTLAIFNLNALIYLD